MEMMQNLHHFADTPELPQGDGGSWKPEVHRYWP